MNKIIRLTLLILSMSVLQAVAADNSVTYEIQISPGLKELQVSACFTGDNPDTLQANSDTAVRYITFLRVNGRQINGLFYPDNKIILTEQGGQSCFSYGVDLPAAAGDVSIPKVKQQHGDLMLRPSSWLWLPKQNNNREIILAFNHDQGISISAPWQLANQTETQTVYRLGSMPFDWQALMAIGKFNIEPISVPHTELRLALLNIQSAEKRNQLSNWIRDGAQMLTRLYGRFPVDSPQILVVPIGEYGEPVPWGQVLRGGAPAVHLFIDPSRPHTEFMHDWTLIHELSHLIHPNLGRDGSWLAEGLATYYQNVLRARAGGLTSEAAWMKLHKGFLRGIKQTRKDITLRQASHDMHKTHEYMRVYWSGTAIALLADVALRSTGGSLDRVLSEFQRCCLPAAEYRDTYRFMKKLDALGKTTVFTDLHDQYVQSDRFPELETVYRELGLVIQHGKLQLDDNAAGTWIRDSIMTGS